METPETGMLSVPFATTETTDLISVYEPLAPSPDPTTGFAGASYSNQYPPDTDGAVGPTHVVDMVNGQFKVHSRNGAVLGSMPLDAFWGVDYSFDPRILYDADADRWIAVSGAAPLLPSSSVLVGVSATGDPTGGWYLWQIDVDDTDVGFADYPQVGFDANVVVVTTNIYRSSDGEFIKPMIFVFDKADLYAGGVVAYVVADSLDPGTWGASLAPSVPYDSGWTDVYMLESLNGNYLGSGYLLAARFSGTVASPTLDPPDLLEVPDPWEGQWSITAPQLGSATGIHTGDDRMGQVVIRNGSMWAVHTIGLPAGSPTHTAIQWWKIATNGSILQRGKIDDSSADTFYAFPSIAVNANNDVLIGFADFASSHYAAGAYAFRKGTDVAGTMREPKVFKTGVAPYVRLDASDRNRWGDYSSTVVDPTNDLDFWTVQEYVANAGNEWGTWWANVVAPASGSYAVKNAYVNKVSVAAGESLTAVVQVRDVVGSQTGRPTVWVLMPDDWSIGDLKDFSSVSLGQHPLGANFSAKKWVETPGNCVVSNLDVGGAAPSGYVWKALRVTDGDVTSPADTTLIERVRIQLVAGSAGNTYDLRFVTGITVDDPGSPGTVASADCSGIYGPAIDVIAP